MDNSYIHNIDAAPPDKGLAHEFKCISTILDGLNALVYVSDMETYELIFFNNYGKSEWGEPQGRTCFKVLQSGQDSPCDFCTNDKLIDDNGNPTGVYVWEFQNTVNKRWYQCRDQAIPWVDGRLVRIGIATDITDRKLLEDNLKQAHEKAELEARKDPFLNCLNRRAFMERSDAVLAHCKRKSSPLSMVMIDIDNFKHLNDRYGHIFGDLVLTEFTQVINETVRKSDVFARYGGDEFVLTLPDTDEKGAINFLIRIQKKLQTIRFDDQHVNASVSLSFGISILHTKSNIDTLLSEADIALYHAKKLGKNRIEVFKSEMSD